MQRALVDPTGSGAMIVGEQGTGKTRLAHEAVGDVTEVEWIVATESASTIPLAGFVRLLPDEVAGAGDGSAFDRAVVAIRQRAARSDGLVIVVDDAHLLDPSGAALLLALAGCDRLRFVLTVRSRVAVPDALAALWKDRIVSRVELAPLSLDETAELLDAVLQGRVHRTTVERLWETTAGNVLFLRELVDDLLRSGTLHLDGAVWQAAGDIAPGPRLGELVHQRISRLSGWSREVVELLALAGPLECGLLRLIHGEATILELEEERFVQIRRDDRRELVRLVHPVYGDVLRATMPSTRRAMLSRRLVEALESLTHRRPGDAVRIAVWALEAGIDVPGPQLVDAAEEANALGSHHQAERLAGLARRAGVRLGGGLALSEALLEQGRFAEAAAVLAGVPEGDDDRTRTRVALARALVGQRSSGDAEAPMRILRAAERRVTDRRCRDLLRTERAVLLAESGDTAGAAALVADVVDDPGADAEVRTRALGPAGRALALGGEPRRALALAAEIRAAAGRASDRHGRRAWDLHLTSLALFHLGELDELDRLAATDAATHRSDERSAHLDLVRARTLLARGRPASALEQLQEADATLERHDVEGWRPWCLAMLTEATAVLGEVARAMSYATQATRARRGQCHLFDSEVDRAQAWALAAQGETSRARAELVELAARCRARGERAVEAQVLHDALRLGERREVVARLEELRILDGAWCSPFAEHARALAAADGGALVEVASRFAAIGALRLAAEVAAEAAAAQARSGSRAAAAGSAARAATLDARCEGTRIPPLAPTTGPRLSRREQEIAALAASGLSNREIADRLVVSVRTVEGHLYRLYAKLGVSDRQGLRVVDGGPTANGRRSDREVVPGGIE